MNEMMPPEVRAMMGERRNRETPLEGSYRRLGAAVIASALRDLEKPTRVGGESARAFLTVSNSHLNFLVQRGGCRGERAPAGGHLNVTLRSHEENTIFPLACRHAVGRTLAEAAAS